MFKFVVLSALFAAAVAEPGLLASPYGYSAPLAYSSVVAPGITTIAQPATSVVQTSSFGYSAPLAYTHFIKKRSAPAFYAPSTYIAGSPLATAYSTPYTYSAPGLVSSASVLPAAPLPYATHFIKKRSAPLLTPYLAPAAYSSQSRFDYTHSSPLISTTYSAPISYSSPLGYSHVL